MSRSSSSPAAAHGTRTRKEPIVEGYKRHLRFTEGTHPEAATPHNRFVSLALATRDAMVERMVATQRVYITNGVKRVYYLSMEYLLGAQLRCNLVNLGVYDAVRDGLAAEGVDLAELCEVERDPGLGNGGLGRLAACYLDSAATLQLPVYGYGIRYEYGIFQQDIVHGWQVERPDYWLRYGSPWEMVRPQFANAVRLYGHIEHQFDATGRYRPRWTGYKLVMGVPYDIPVSGYGSNTVNMLRLWSARASETFDLTAFNRGGYVEAVRDRVLTETITKVLYPADATESGRELRLVQQYFFVACTLADMVRRFERDHDSIDLLPEKVAIQLNDTHPSIAIAELMRFLVDERGLEWERGWDLTRRTIAYTNHTLLPEALEKWPVDLFERVLPRHLQIIFEINRRFLEGEVESRWPGDADRKRRLSLIQEESPRSVRMANLAIAGSHRVNGVAELHTKLICSRLVPDFAELWPEKFINVTNGVTPRRWVRACNPRLSAAISKRIGEGWVTDLDQLTRLEKYADDPDLHGEVRAAKLSNKRDLTDWLRRAYGLLLRPEALFDLQVKRLHEYKRQLLNILGAVIRYHRLLEDPTLQIPPRVVLFGAKAAPAYNRAKLIIKLINDVANTINGDGRVSDRLKIAFVPNYRVSLAEKMIPAADLSEQISTAGMEASGTGNMKFAMNGALTIGTLDGANIEIREAVGEENFFLFGLTEQEVEARRPDYDPIRIYESNAEIRKAIDAIASGEFNLAQPGLFRDVRNWLTHDRDFFMVLADLPSYLEAQDRVDALWQKPEAWTRAAILNMARMGRFSSDRSVREYAERIWQVAPVPIEVEARLRPKTVKARSAKPGGGKRKK